MFVNRDCSRFQKQGLKKWSNSHFSLNTTKSAFASIVVFNGLDQFFFIKIGPINIGEVIF